jgi:hypothetical protein
LKPRIFEGEVIINDKNVPIWPQQKDKRGKPYEGMGVRPEQIKQHKEQWGKIKDSKGGTGSVGWEYEIPTRKERPNTKCVGKSGL